jgi:predicted metal-dependent hydrolase
MQIDLPFATSTTGHLARTIGTGHPASAEHSAPRLPHPAPGIEHTASSTQHLAPGTQHLAPGTQHLAPSAEHSVHSSPNTAPVLHLVRHPRARRYVIRVRSDGTVRVTIPRGGSQREARQFAERQREWIDKHRALAAQEQARVRETAAPDVEREWRARAARELPARLLELAAVHGLTVVRISVRNQRWRWGSCSRSGHICLNWRLAQMPPSIRDYVMLHELMHFKQMNHSPKFWKLVATVCPDYEAARQWLREHARQNRP